MSKARWYFKCGFEERGPFSAEQLQRMAKNGEIRFATMVRNESSGAAQPTRRSLEWQEAGRLAFGGVL